MTTDQGAAASATAHALDLLASWATSELLRGSTSVNIDGVTMSAEPLTDLAALLTPADGPTSARICS